MSTTVENENLVNENENEIDSVKDFSNIALKINELHIINDSFRSIKYCKRIRKAPLVN